jgi:hypothetical protein
MNARNRLLKWSRNAQNRRILCVMTIQPDSATSEEQTCVHCHRTFFPHSRHKQRFCSVRCRTADAVRFRSDYKARGIPSGTVGAIAELRVAADLLGKGFEVFRALSQSCSCDLAILRDGKLVRVEVRSGYYKSGDSTTPVVSKREHRADVLAIAMPDQVIYEPSL